MPHTRKSVFRLIAALALGLAAAIGHAADGRPVSSELHEFRVVTLVKGLDHPWSIAWLPDGRMLVTERPGRLRIVSPDFTLDSRPVEGLPKIEAVGQGGLFDAVPHPQYAENGWIYISYNARGDNGHGTELMRARLDGHRLVDQQVLFRLEPKSRTGQHFGGRIVFDRKGHVFLTLGDRGERNRAQQLDDHAGSVIRLNEDGSVPGDNPFVKRPGARPEIYALGIRNVQAAALHPETGELWVADHGPQGGDEVNIIRTGRNYGWPLVTRGREYGTGRPIGMAQREGFEPALHYWVPTSIAPSGFAFYEGERFPAWRGHALIGALRGETLVRLDVDGKKVLREERMMTGIVGRIRDVRMGPDGYVYLLTDQRRGVLARLEPAS
jgi:aldose sugar dehydrogenase